jgi:hypothetical protein
LFVDARCSLARRTRRACITSISPFRDVATSTGAKFKKFKFASDGIFELTPRGETRRRRAIAMKHRERALVNENHTLTDRFIVYSP